MSLNVSRNTFFRKTRKGDVIKQVNELYSHADFEVGFLLGAKLELDNFFGIVRSSSVQKAIVIDTNILLHHMDIFEDSSSISLLDVLIIPQTALSELRHLNISMYKRAINLLRDENRHCIFFPNSCCTAIATQR